jgi:D-alanyl-D-alanine carboxypeptidase
MKKWALLAAVGVVGALGACASPSTHVTPAAAPGTLAASAPTSPPATPSPTTTPTPTAPAPSPTATATPTPTPTPTATAPAAFRGTSAKVTAKDVPHSWRSGCPVGPAQLRKLAMSYWGFDGAPHTGTMIVNQAVAGDVLKVFKTLYDARFPVRKMQPVDAYGGSDPKSMADDNTSGFNCRYAVAPGPKSWSVHAYGEAIDINTVENPYLEGGQIMPAAGQAYLARSPYRAGMAVKGGVLVKAFAAVGWKWGGRWTSNPDYQHFSKTGG